MPKQGLLKKKAETAKPMSDCNESELEESLTQLGKLLIITIEYGYHVHLPVQAEVKTFWPPICIICNQHKSYINE